MAVKWPCWLWNGPILSLVAQVGLETLLSPSRCFNFRKKGGVDFEWQY